MSKINSIKFFKKIFIYFFVSFISLTSHAHSEVVEKIVVNGNERISLETIVVFGDIVLGKDYESSDITPLIKKLYNTKFFSEINVEIKNKVLIVTVKENPIINEIKFEGEKASKFQDQISELLILKENGAFVENSIKTDINLIKDFYRALGFYFVKIDADVIQLKKNRVNLSYKIEKGEKAKINKIFFLGDKKIREKKLRDVVTSQEASFWKFLSRSVYLDQNRLELDKRLLKNYYRNNGYYEVDIKTTNVEYSDGEGFVLTYNINAGPRYRFTKINILLFGKVRFSCRL